MHLGTNNWRDKMDNPIAKRIDEQGIALTAVINGLTPNMVPAESVVHRRLQSIQIELQHCLHQINMTAKAVECASE